MKNNCSLSVGGVGPHKIFGAAKSASHRPVPPNSSATWRAFPCRFRRK